MESIYEQLVLCRHKGDERTFLFRAPAFSNLGGGDEVIVKTKNGEKLATVVMKADVEKKSEEYEMIVEAAGATLPLKKVLRKVLYEELIYEEGENDKQG